MLTSEASETVFRWFKSELAHYFSGDNFVSSGFCIEQFCETL